MKAESQRLFLSMSLMSLILVAVFSNEHLLSSQRPLYVSMNSHAPGQLESVNRAIASAQPVHIFRDLEWEHRLARKLGVTHDRGPASVSENVTLMDEMKYGPLAGKYFIRTVASEDASQVKEIHYVDSDDISGKPVRLRDSRQFLLRYRRLMSIPYLTAELAYQADGLEVWQLLDNQHNAVGRARMNYDSAGHFMGVQFESL